MEKIRTVFERDWEGNRGVVDKYVDPPEGFTSVYDTHNILARCIATEKVDGTNVRLTIRNGILVRLEKRRNATEVQKKLGIKEPWYVDADEYGPEDKYIWEAARNTDLKDIPDNDWSGEAVGPKIQGNPLNLSEHKVVLFSLSSVRNSISLLGAPLTFGALKQWLPLQKSQVGIDCGIEGIVWWYGNNPVFKIKCKDFK